MFMQHQCAILLHHIEIVRRMLVTQLDLLSRYLYVSFSKEGSSGVILPTIAFTDECRTCMVTHSRIARDRQESDKPQSVYGTVNPYALC